MIRTLKNENSLVADTANSVNSWFNLCNRCRLKILKGLDSSQIVPSLKIARLGNRSLYNPGAEHDVFVPRSYKYHYKGQQVKI